MDDQREGYEQPSIPGFGHGHLISVRTTVAQCESVIAKAQKNTVNLVQNNCRIHMLSIQFSPSHE